MLKRCLIGSTVYSTCDYIIQRKHGREYDYKRTIGSVIYGGMWLNPFLTKWYAYIDKPTNTIFRKVFFDQTIAAPINTSVFYTIHGVLQEEDLKQKFQDKFIQNMFSLWTLWVPVQIINLTLVPLKHRVYVVNAVGVSWSLYLNWFEST